jgi:hypothetical protein
MDIARTTGAGGVITSRNGKNDADGNEKIVIYKV